MILLAPGNTKPDLEIDAAHGLNSKLRFGKKYRSE